MLGLDEQLSLASLVSDSGPALMPGLDGAAITHGRSRVSGQRFDSPNRVDRGHHICGSDGRAFAVIASQQTVTQMAFTGRRG